VQYVQGYHVEDVTEIAQKVSDSLEQGKGKLRVSSIAMSEVWPVKGDGWIHALVVFERD
jgi:hypothetical protein